MSRSWRRAPFVGRPTARSEKDDKVAAHRRERRRGYVLLAAVGAGDAPGAGRVVVRARC